MKNKLFFSLSFNNQDIYYIELDSIIDNTVLISAIADVKKHINELHSPEKIIIHLEQTHLNNTRITEIIDFVLSTKNYYNKLCFVGVHGINRLILDHKMKKTRKIFSIPWTVINDYQKAKEWIVSKST